MSATNQEGGNETDLLTDFKKGYVYFLTGFQSLVGSFLQFLSSGLTETNKREILSFRKNLDQELDKSQKKIKEIIFNLDEKHMYAQVRKEYSRYFSSQLDESSRYDFIQFHLIFEMLRYFYIESYEGWILLRDVVTNTKFSDQDFQTNSLLNYRILPALERLYHLEIFLKRMSFILQVNNQNFLTEYKPTKPKFRDRVIYRLSSVFDETLYDKPEALEPQDSDIVYKSEEVIQNEIQESDKTKQLQNQKPKPKEEGNTNYIQAYGKYTWNSDQHYFFRYEMDKYLAEKALFKSAISLDLHLGADEQLLRAELIRSMTSTEKKNKSAEDFEVEYQNFLKQFFQFCENIILMNMMIPNQVKYVFLFHLGPSHFYMIAKKFLMEVNTGYIHSRGADGKKVNRVIPGEYVKKHVIDYWNETILPNVGEEKNNLALLKKLTEMIEEKYIEISKLTIQKYDELDEEIKNSKPRELIFREYMNEWMGAANIIIFKRFVKNKSF
ncbi:hypothetical protein [Leptospira harrisiae]|uniref:Uncharacterized protein n=1 Tax=Leptospira harrisiae TaxID=2023189 RepID=A0A2N0AJR2_9LEPT|nr:hypothetical protein [Leptospira harrisiae]PJZ84461.1 hypothetical protein CH364_10575 [Leptospira harrisiae]PKA07205.1 hypothetical protein CH366_12275 [Leptospira harrisiae]